MVLVLWRSIENRSILIGYVFVLFCFAFSLGFLLNCIQKSKVTVNPISQRVCLCDGCNNPARTTKERGTQYCSNECIVKHCRYNDDCSYILDDTFFLESLTPTKREDKQHSDMISFLIIHQIFLVTCDWSKFIMWLNIPQQKLGNIWD